MDEKVVLFSAEQKETMLEYLRLQERAGLTLTDVIEVLEYERDATSQFHERTA